MAKLGAPQGIKSAALKPEDREAFKPSQGGRAVVAVCERDENVMATTGILRSRRSAAQLHAIASVEREIRAVDRAAGRKYIRDFRDAYDSYQRVLSENDVRREIARSGLVLVGDYHALPNSQRYLASLLRETQLHRRPVVLGIETIFSRAQPILHKC